jgi:hypothetical protein
MKYETNNLDEAAYLALQGYHITVKRTGPRSAVFSFETDTLFNEVRAKVLEGRRDLRAAPLARHTGGPEERMRWPAVFGKTRCVTATRACGAGDGSANGLPLLVS